MSKPATNPNVPEAAADEAEAVVDAVEVRFVAPAALLPALEPVCWLLSPNGILVDDIATLGAGDLAPDQCRVSLYVPPADVDGCLRVLRAEGVRHGLALEPALREVVREDWNRVWKQHFHAFQVGDRIRVEPSWEQGPDRPGQLRIAIDPGLAFGTGTHETTRLAMLAVQAWADELRARGVDLARATVLDVGTGSAILAILAVQLGAGQAVGTELDADAVDSARANLVLNAVADRIELRHTDDPAELAPRRFDLVLANIISSVLLPLRDRIVARLAPGGTLILSGILGREAATVRDAYAATGLPCTAEAHDGDWAALTFRRPG